MRPRAYRLTWAFCDRSRIVARPLTVKQRTEKAVGGFRKDPGANALSFFVRCPAWLSISDGIELPHLSEEQSVEGDYCAGTVSRIPIKEFPAHCLRPS
jgi:hypothetical protein